MKQTFLTAATAARLVSTGFVLLSGSALLWVSLMAFWSPQAVMDLVGVRLPSADAASSIRGVYGGVGLTICGYLAVAVRRQLNDALIFLTSLWGCYALSRIVTGFVEGPLGAFGTQWLRTEAVLAVVALGLWVWRRRVATGEPGVKPVEA
jgi:nitrate reductase gamma subunit